MKCPPKLKFFLWKSLNEAIPVHENLKKRKLAIVSTCHRCGEGSETTAHCLFQCKVSKEIWSLAPMPTPSATYIQQHSIINVFKCFKAISKQDQASSLFPFLMWQIWKSRNAILYEGKQWSIPNIINKSIADSIAWTRANQVDATIEAETVVAENGQVIREESNKLTTRPAMTSEPSTYVCFLDASWLIAKEKIGIAWVLCKNMNEIVVWSRGSIAAMGTAVEAEVEAI